MLLRALLAAAVALLVSAEAPRLGAAAFSPWRLLWPWTAFFVALEFVRARRRVGAEDAFLAGAAAALAFQGVYTKELQHGLMPLGVDWLGAAGVAFDGGLTAVLSLHLLQVLRPRREEDGEPSLSGAAPAVALVGVTAAAAALVFGLKTAYGIHRVDRLLGAGWLTADLGFLAVAWLLIGPLRRGEEEGERAGTPWPAALAAGALAVPAARLCARVAAAFELPGALMWGFAAAGAGVLAWLVWRLWRDRVLAEPPEEGRSRAALAAALWRALAALALWSQFDPADQRLPAVFSLVVELPTRAVFAFLLLSSRLKV
jgi:hypothetical protein